MAALPLLRHAKRFVHASIFWNRLGFFVRAGSVPRPIRSDRKTCSIYGMQKRLDTQERLEILRTTDNYRRWYSLDDKRVCAVCEKIISGRQIEIRGGPEHYTLHCPTPDCPSNFSHWYLYRLPDGDGSSIPSPTTTAEMSFLRWADR